MRWVSATASTQPTALHLLCLASHPNISSKSGKFWVDDFANISNIGLQSCDIRDQQQRTISVNALKEGGIVSESDCFKLQ